MNKPLFIRFKMTDLTDSVKVGDHVIVEGLDYPMRVGTREGIPNAQRWSITPT